jgi:hypothetical protein
VLIALLAIIVPLLWRRRDEPPVRPAGDPPSRGLSSGPPRGAGLGNNPFDPEPYGDEVSATRRERSGALR